MWLTGSASQSLSHNICNLTQTSPIHSSPQLKPPMFYSRKLIPEASLSVSQNVKNAAFGISTTFIFLVSTSVSDVASALDINSAQNLFQRSCIGCHVGGGNIIQPGATLRDSDMQQNGILNVDDIFKITYSGKGRMPGFGEKCMPRGQCTFGPRLKDEEIQAIAEYVRLQADRGWVNVQ